MTNAELYLVATQQAMERFWFYLCCWTWADLVSTGIKHRLLGNWICWFQNFFLLSRILPATKKQPDYVMTATFLSKDFDRCSGRQGNTVEWFTWFKEYPYSL